MPTYVCESCGYKTTRTFNFKRHCHYHAMVRAGAARPKLPRRAQGPRSISGLSDASSVSIVGLSHVEDFPDSGTPREYGLLASVTSPISTLGSTTIINPTDLTLKKTTSQDENYYTTITTTTIHPKPPPSGPYIGNGCPANLSKTPQGHALINTPSHSPTQPQNENTPTNPPPMKMPPVDIHLDYGGLLTRVEEVEAWRIHIDSILAHLGAVFRT